MRHLVVLAVVVWAVAAACSAAPATTTPATGAPTATTGASSPIATPAASVAGSPDATIPVVALPGRVVLADIGGNAPVSGTATFAQQGLDTAVTFELQGTGALLPFPDEVFVLLMPGTCADLTQPVNVPGAIASNAIEIVGGIGNEPLVVPIAALEAPPLSIVVTNAPGDINLACGDVVTLG